MHALRRSTPDAYAVAGDLEPVAFVGVLVAVGPQAGDGRDLLEAGRVDHDGDTGIAGQREPGVGLDVVDEACGHLDELGRLRDDGDIVADDEGPIRTGFGRGCRDYGKGHEESLRQRSASGYRRADSF